MWNELHKISLMCNIFLNVVTEKTEQISVSTKSHLKPALPYVDVNFLCYTFSSFLCFEGINAY